ncbi:hypothetical protein AMATHDRAFT_8050 [Amanita thiersii Skay4041]|uniref:Uncharacterized protein n=1 Tax=Amanita thiersii Skay4041 TaxID=703135 RepID=A0A2A9N7B1_9AGAR|nr:hypothetical protein AMATHDRAFT_8050 [Amanita thiersii Skay4041]
MSPAFSRSFRHFFHSSTPSMGPSHLETVKKLTDNQKADTWSSVVFGTVANGNDDLFNTLREWRVCKWHYYKERSTTQHEYIIVLLTNNGEKMALRIERTIGPRSSKSKADGYPDGTKSESALPLPHQPPRSLSPLPISQHIPDSQSLPVSQSPPDSPLLSESSADESEPSSPSLRSSLSSYERFIDYCKCLVSSLRTGSYWAKDNIKNVTNKCNGDGELKDRTALKSFEYKDEPSFLGPSLWDLAHIVQFVHFEGENYKLLDAQCYWYADTVTGILESWVDAEGVISNSPTQKGLRLPFLPKRTSSMSEQIGHCQGVLVYSRDVERLKGMCTTVKQHISAADERIRSILEPRKFYEEKLRKSQAAYAELELQVKEVNTKNEAMKRSNEAMAKELVEVKADNQAMAKELVEVKADNQAMANKLVAVEADNKAMGMKLNDMQNEMALFFAEFRGQKAMEQQYKMTR